MGNFFEQELSLAIELEVVSSPRERVGIRRTSRALITLKPSPPNAAELNRRPPRKLTCEYLVSPLAIEAGVEQLPPKRAEEMAENYSVTISCEA